jgi:hypothetical protein
LKTHKGKIDAMLFTLDNIEQQYVVERSKLGTDGNVLTGQLSIFD